MIEMRLPDPTTLEFLLGLKRIHFSVLDECSIKCDCCGEQVSKGLECWSLPNSYPEKENTIFLCLGLCLQAIVINDKYLEILDLPAGSQDLIGNLTNDD